MVPVPLFISQFQPHPTIHSPPIIKNSIKNKTKSNAMSTSFSSLPIVSLSALSSTSVEPEELLALSARLDEAFSTTGFVYLTDLPLTFGHDEIFRLCDEFFGPDGLSLEEKMTLAKKTFVKSNENTYRGYINFHFYLHVPR
jgi:isopenicillin N synthase-like dioxygenase